MRDRDDYCDGCRGDIKEGQEHWCSKCIDRMHKELRRLRIKCGEEKE